MRLRLGSLKWVAFETLPYFSNVTQAWANIHDSYVYTSIDMGLYELQTTRVHKWGIHKEKINTWHLYKNYDLGYWAQLLEPGLEMHLLTPTCKS